MGKNNSMISSVYRYHGETERSKTKMGKLKSHGNSRFPIGKCKFPWENVKSHGRNILSHGKLKFPWENRIKIQFPLGILFSHGKITDSHGRVCFPMGNFNFPLEIVKSHGILIFPFILIVDYLDNFKDTYMQLS